MVLLASYDIILGMDWLMPHKALIKFQERWVDYIDEPQTGHRVHSDQGPFEPYLITIMQVKISIREREIIYAFKIKEVEQNEKDIEVLNKYPLL